MKQLEETVSRQSQAPTRADPTSRPDVAPDKPNPVSLQRLRISNEAHTTSKAQGILYNAKTHQFFFWNPKSTGTNRTDATERAKFSIADVEYIKFIQNLHIAGNSKEEICKRTLDVFPDLCNDGTEENRLARVRSMVDLNTSSWALKYMLKIFEAGVL